MKKKFFIFFILCIFICLSDTDRVCAVEYVQSLSSGNLDTTDSNLSITYTNAELPNFSNDTDNTEENTGEIYYPNGYYYYPYYYTPYQVYRIGPYYSRGLTTGGYNYKGFAYKYKGGYNFGSTSAKKTNSNNLKVQPPPTQINQPSNENTIK